MKKIFRIVSIFAFVLVGCSNENTADKDNKGDKVIRVGATVAPHAEILEEIKEDLEKEGYTLEVKVFDDYVLPNTAVDEGDLDANFFQHKPYLDSFNEEKGTDLVSIAKIHFEPLGIYNIAASEKNPKFSVDDVKEGALIAVPDDPSNEARALQLLADHGIIELKKGVGLKATKTDITKNPKNVDIKEVKADGIPATLADVDFAVINGNYALSGKVEDKFIVGEAVDSAAAKKYANIIAIKAGEEDKTKIKALVKALETEKVKTFIKETYGELVVAVF